MFFVYLATLMHTYLLEKYFKPDMSSMRKGREETEMSDAMSDFSSYNEGFLSAIWTQIYHFIRVRIQWAGRYILHLCIGSIELVSRTISSTERSPHWVKVTLKTPTAGPLTTWQSYEGLRYLQYCLQVSVDWLRHVDIEDRSWNV